ncbi:Integrase_core domain-containing protein [Hexamita inflata]|uniref:Integrase core domain-containing protein n=1 Tax=Hexamita inflata TaxID=28002 RepID=A0AA86NJ55_9EUKA|nr:Integrase core domain-containing protein [Hexamita inflata]
MLEFAALPVGRSKSYPNERQSKQISEFVALSCGYQAARKSMLKYASLFAKGELDVTDPLVHPFWELAANYADCQIPTEAQFYNYFDLHRLLLTKREPSEQETPHNERRDAKCPMMLLHTDLHCLNGMDGVVLDGVVYKYIIVFIDSFSRYIVHWGFMQDKTAECAADQLQMCINIGIGQQIQVMASAGL